jgi:hypothetical protein
LLEFAELSKTLIAVLPLIVPTILEMATFGEIITNKMCVICLNVHLNDFSPKQLREDPHASNHLFRP